MKNPKGFRIHAEGKTFPLSNSVICYGPEYKIGESGLVYREVPAGNSKAHEIILALRGPYVVEYIYG